MIQIHEVNSVLNHEINITVYNSENREGISELIRVKHGDNNDLFLSVDEAEFIAEMLLSLVTGLRKFRPLKESGAR